MYVPKEDVASSFVKRQFEELKERMDRIEEAIDDVQEDLSQRMTRIDLALQKIMDHLQVDSRDKQARIAHTDLTLRNMDAPHGQQAAATENTPVVIDGPYPYTALEHTQSQIRILELYYDLSFTDPIRASLKTISLDEPPVSAIKRPKRLGSTFTALSYCWGPPVMDHSIIVDGYRIPITQSLDLALRHLRDFYMDGVSVWEKDLWIDQLCINQSDFDERSNQVSLMRRIYKKASNVHVWLGDESDTSSKAIDLLTTLGAPSKNAPGEAIRYESLEEADVTLNWEALGSFFNRPWFERVWIRQEIALHDKVLLSCGNKTIDIATLELALVLIDCVKSLGHYSASASKEHTSEAMQLPWDYHPTKLTQLRKDTGCGSQWVQLGKLILDVRGCEATDARDMVFSVIGMADPAVFSIVPDYRRDLRNVYITAAEQALCHGMDLDILAACQNPGRKHGLPSWVPNLADCWRYLPFDAQRIKNDLAKNNGRHRQWVKTDKRFAEVQVQGETLVLKGEIVDDINWMSPRIVDYTSTAAQIEDVYRSWLDLVETALVHCEWPHILRGYRPNANEASQKKALEYWILFLSAWRDHGSRSAERDADRLWQQQHPKQFGCQYQTPLNHNLARSYLLPADYTGATLHPNRRVHMAMLMSCVGRRFCITRRGMVALVPEDAKIGLQIAVFRGCLSQYVVGQPDDQGHRILFGDAFVPSYAVRAPGTRNMEAPMETVIYLC
jgi:hypothetical protein